MSERTKRKRKGNTKKNPTAGPVHDDSSKKRKCAACGLFVSVQTYSHHWRQCPRRNSVEAADDKDTETTATERPVWSEKATAAFLGGLETVSLMPHRQAPVPEHLRAEEDYFVGPGEVQVTRTPAPWWKHGEGNESSDDSNSLSSCSDASSLAQESLVSRLSGFDGAQIPQSLSWEPSQGAMQEEVSSTMGDVRFQYEALEESASITLVKEWSWTPPANMADTALKRLIDSGKGRHLGQCFLIPPGLSKSTSGVSRLSDQEISMLRLVDFCNQNAVTGRCFVDRILDLVAEEMSGPRQFDPRNLKGLRRQTLCRKVANLYGRGCEPSVVHITTSSETGNIAMMPGNNAPSGKKASIPVEVDNRERFVLNCIVFNIEAQIRDLLGDEQIFGTDTNLVINPDNPFLPYVNKSDYVDEILDGTWHSESIDRVRAMESDPFVDGAEFKLDIILYCDKTGTAGNQRYPLEPFLFTFAQIRRKLRNLPQCWRPAGYIPDLDTKSSAERRYINARNRGATSQTYHLCLEQILQGFEEIQKKGMLEWLRIGSYRKFVRIRPEICCIISDGKAADMNTGRTPSTHSTRRISRSCTTLQATCDNVIQECDFIKLTPELRKHFHAFGASAGDIRDDSMYRIEGSGGGSRKPTKEEAEGIVSRAKAELDRQSFVPTRNAFVARCIRFGLDPRAIWGASPTDLMHAFQSGIVKYLVKMIIDKLSTAKQVRLDRLVHKLFHNLRSKEKADYPRLTFSKGFSKLSMITSDEWVGKLFVLLIVLKTEEGASIFQKTFAREDLALPGSMTAGISGDRKNRQARGFAEVVEQILTQAQDFNTGASELEVNQTYVAEAEEDAMKHTGEEEPEEMLRPCSKNDFTELAEALLSFHAWYKLGLIRKQRDGKVDRSLIHASVSRMLAMVRFYTPRKKGNGWKIQKFHDLLHVALDIERFGPPSNFDAGPSESGLKTWAKLPAMTSQKRGYNTFLWQVASRITEGQCITKALREHGVKASVDTALDRAIASLANREEMDSSVDRTPVLGGSTYRIYGRRTDDDTREHPFRPSEKVHRDKRAKSEFTIHPSIENFLRWQPLEDPSVLAATDATSSVPYWELKTECSMVPEDSSDRLLLRCHPNFQNEGPWYDWVLVNFSTSLFFHKPGLEGEYNARRKKRPKERTLEPKFDPMQHEPQNPDTCVPCKVMAFAKGGDGEIMALVHGCKFRTTNNDIKGDTVLLEFWRLEYRNLYEELPPNLRNTVPRGGRRQPGVHDYEVPFLCWVKLKSIVGRCFVIEEEPGIHEVQPYTRPSIGKPKPSNRVILIRPHSLWAEEFTNTDE